MSACPAEPSAAVFDVVVQRLYYARVRYFDPNFGRFLTPDSHLGTANDPFSQH